MYESEDITFTKLFNELFPQLCYYSDVIIDNKEEAKDIVVDAFTEVWNNRNKYDNIKPVLFTTVRNKSLNYLRNHKRELKRHSEYVNKEEPVMNVEQAIIQTDILKELASALHLLPEKYQRVFKLTVEGFSIDEIAVKTNCSDNTVSQQKKRAIFLLKRKLNYSI